MQTFCFELLVGNKFVHISLSQDGLIERSCSEIPLGLEPCFEKLRSPTFPEPRGPLIKVVLLTFFSGLVCFLVMENLQMRFCFPFQLNKSS